MELPPLRPTQIRPEEEYAAVKRVFTTLERELKRNQRATRMLPVLTGEGEIRSMVMLLYQQVEQLKRNDDQLQIGQAIHHTEISRLTRIASAGHIQLICADVVDRRTRTLHEDVIAEAKRSRKEANDRWAAVIEASRFLEQRVSARTRDEAVSRWAYFLWRFRYRASRVLAAWKCVFTGHELGAEFASTLPGEKLRQCSRCDRLVR